MKILFPLVVAAAIIALAAIGFAYSGIYNVSASASHSGFVQWLFSTTSHASIERHAGAVATPDLDDESLVLAGINDFNSMCIGCHGAPGIDREAVGQGLNPLAPNLAEEAAEMTPAELFWVTKNGIKMTGMPAWGVTHGDDAIWPVVAFMTRLPNLDAAAYQTLLASAEGHGHHGSGAAEVEHSHEEDDEAAGEGHSHEESEASADSEVHAHADGLEHVHEEAAAIEEPAADDHGTHEHNR